MRPARKIQLDHDGELIEAVEIEADPVPRRMKPKPEKQEREYPRFLLMVALIAIVLFVLLAAVVYGVVVWLPLAL